MLALLPAAARADTSDTQVAEELFARGKERLAAGDYAQACPLFAESHRLDPATGTLLALAVCHERDGKLVSAFGEYNDVATRARAERRKDRAAALEDRLSSLTIVATELAALRAPEVRIDGERLAPAQLDKPLRLDGGIKQVDVSAEGMQSSFVIGRHRRPARCAAACTTAGAWAASGAFGAAVRGSFR